ncbi:MAG: 30S ribosomal protein S4 [Candidatus Harrisonbacteria bacterium RIFCSPHIGHO2_01_FULL_44_13]|uniref:Small ribosomal subunit protein uS4 n=1 Tax=Candidatus Harrisonbacteria bacterium RIFCSPLOWO2_01_FULL_44_18 TaxID=1798407 RepID=A0A1G1ZMR5_9BACT|nr:MAG: 30S ribosomal protein S4 [Candidatus Harrisonbacteria bacterium RIFCSPHIGHO2_01_FULL_44_13]OGY65864.1 MAG: 30S ribosomal protein S4 [Candidatus Harrisonbacteria bacterium RIFCSPLOWO2_01_FULL_44_18]
MFDTKEKKERSLGTKLFLKANRCNSPKCVTVRRPQRPGVHGKARRRALSEMGQQLQEKQKFRFTYGIREAQMRKIFSAAVKNPGVTGEMIVNLLERRLDNVVFRLGLAPSRSVARQLTGHGHILVNNRKVTIPSYRVKVNDIISIRPQSKDHPVFNDLAASIKKYDPPVWLNLDKEKIEGRVISLPRDSDISFDVNKVVDYYSKIQ